MIPQVLPIRFLLNPGMEPGRPYGEAEASILSLRGHEQARRVISSWPGYAPTPLLALRGLARRLGIAALWYKDEGSRLGLGSFKALGGTYGVLRTLEDTWLQRPGGDPRPGAPGPTVTCASAGNHGLAVARGASMFGCRAVIFLPKGTEEARQEAIRREGGEIRTVAGSYDDAVQVAAAAAREEEWLLVSDTAYPGYEELPRHIMQGYTVMIGEALEQLPAGVLPTHVFVQGGVGGLAAAVAGHLWESLGPRRPTIVVVEPAEADCLLESALRRRPTPSRGTLATNMACLACRNPSTLAWAILGVGADAFLTIPDYAADETVRVLAKGCDGDPPVLSQPSGVAGLTGLMATLFEPALANPLGLEGGSRVLLFGSEGPPTVP